MGFAMLVLLNLSIFGMTFASANKLKGWTFVIIGCHLAILATVAGFIHHKKVKREFRAVVDDETYYECYPRDYGRMLKRKERERRRLERQQARYPINE